MRGMHLDPLMALHAAARPPSPLAGARTGDESLFVIGAAGTLGAAVLEHALTGGRYARVHVATTGSLRTALRGLQTLDLRLPQAAVPAAGAAMIVFDRSRSFNGREDAFFQPEPDQLVPLARWLREGGVDSLAVVLPHAPAMLPQALRHGLATLDEQAVAALGFTRLLIVRPTQVAAGAATSPHPLQRVADWCLSQLSLMLPANERPVRAPVVADFVLEVLRQWPRDEAGTKVAGAELIWAAARGEAPRVVVARWLKP